MALWRKPKSEAESTACAPSPAPSTGRDRTIRESLELHLGAGVHVRGELTGTQDVVLDGTAEGEVNLADHAFTVGRAAHVDAEVVARRVTVHGHVTGNIVATECVLVASSGDVSGNLSAPRIVLADGCTFNGSVNQQASETAQHAASVKIIRQAQPVRQAPIRPEPARPRQQQPKQPQPSVKKVEQSWSSGGGAFWTMSRPYDEEARQSPRPTRPKAFDRLPADVTVEILDS